MCHSAVWAISFVGVVSQYRFSTYSLLRVRDGVGLFVVLSQTQESVGSAEIQLAVGGVLSNRREKLLWMVGKSSI